MSGEEEAAELTIAEDAVVNKYKMGGEIANRECGPALGAGLGAWGEARRGEAAAPPARRGDLSGRPCEEERCEGRLPAAAAGGALSAEGGGEVSGKFLAGGGGSEIRGGGGCCGAGRRGMAGR